MTNRMNRFELNTALYTPDGRLLQIEYAAKAVDNGFTVIGIRGKDCVLLAVDRIVKSSLYEPDADIRIFTVDRNLGMVMTGFTPDGYVVVEAARREVSNYRLTCMGPIPVSILCERVAVFINESTRHGDRRPYGISVFMAAWDEFGGPQLYKIEPCGNYGAYFACAMGRAKTQAYREIDKRFSRLLQMGTEELVKTAGEIIYKTHYDRRRRDFVLDLGIVCEATGGKHLINPPELTEMARLAGEEAAANESSSSDDPFI